jgi:hypothetical protein
MKYISGISAIAKVPPLGAANHTIEQVCSQKALTDEVLKIPARGGTTKTNLLGDFFGT